jgi:hypothetical protein
MPTTVSTTALTPFEIQGLNESSTGQACTNIASQIAAAQKHLADLQKKQPTVNVAHQATLNRVLSSRTPKVTVPPGATIVRTTVNGVDSLLVQTP